MPLVKRLSRALQPSHMMSMLLQRFVSSRQMLLAVIVCLTWVAPSFADAIDNGFIVGVGSHFGQGKGNVKQTIDLMQQANIISFRDEIFWQQIETVKGQLKVSDNMKSVENAVDIAVSKGIQPLIILDYGNKLYGGGLPVTDEAREGFARYSAFVVNHFKGRVKYYEVWNEWNSKGSPQDYAQLLKKVYPAVKKVDPSIVVLAGAVEGAGKYDYIESLMQQDIVNFMDGFSIHPYVFWKGQKVGTPEYLVNWVQKLEETVLQKASGGKTVPIYITEIGWPSDVTELGVQQERVADYLARVLLSLRTLPYVKGVWWYNFMNDGDNAKKHDDNFGLLDSHRQPKPAYASMQQVAALVSKAQFVQKVPTSKDVWMLRFRNIDGSETLASWRTSGEERWQVHFDSDDAKIDAVQRVKGMAAAGHIEDDSEKAKSPVMTINESPVVVQAKKTLAVKSTVKVQ